MPNTTSTVNVNSLTYGVEIECYIPMDAWIGSGWTVGAYHVGNRVPGFPGWTAQRDGSLGSAPSDGPYCAVEIVSPILRGQNGLDQIKAVCAKLNEMGAKVNRSTGFHVHVGWTGDAEALRRLVHLVAHVEPGLWAAQGSKWRELNSTFCATVKGATTWKEASEANGAAALENVARYYHRGRYMVLNLMNLLGGSSKRTVEFRLFSGTTNADKIVAYVQIALGLVQKAMEVTTVAKWDAEPLTEKSAVRSSGNGLSEVNRLVALLGWTKAFNCTMRGIIDPEARQTSIAVLRAMAKKYDTR